MIFWLEHIFSVEFFHIYLASFGFLFFVKARLWGGFFFPFVSYVFFSFRTLSFVGTWTGVFSWQGVDIIYIERGSDKPLILHEKSLDSASLVYKAQTPAPLQPDSLPTWACTYHYFRWGGAKADTAPNPPAPARSLARQNPTKKKKPPATGIELPAPCWLWRGPSSRSSGYTSGPS